MAAFSKICRKACPPAKSFLDLPGELRNKIYEDALSASPSSFAAHLPLLHSNKQIRAEFLPLFFGRTIEADISNFGTFAFVFFGPDIAKLKKKGFKKQSRCTVIVHKKLSRTTTVSLPWLASFLQQNPGFGVLFELSGWEKSASDLNLLVGALRENSASWTSLLDGDLTFKPGYRWEITLRVKKVGDGPSWSHDRTRNRQADALLVSLGLYKHISALPPVIESKRSFEVILRQDVEGSKFASAVPRLKIKVFQVDGVNVHTFPINYKPPVRKRRG
jgi:hypothetical protein